MTSSSAISRNLTLTKEEEIESEKYNLVNLLEASTQINKPIYITAPGTNESNYFQEDIIVNEALQSENLVQGDKVLSELEGVIDTINEDTVRVKLVNKIYANFPKILFTDDLKIIPGQHVKYSIKQNINGFRYQKITPIENNKEHPRKKEILNILNEFKYRDE